MTTLGVVLLIVGALVAVFEAHRPTHGAAGGAGVVLLAVGAVLAVSSAGAGALVGVGVGALVALCGGAGVAVCVRHAAQVRGARARTGAEAMIGRVGVVRSWTDAGGSVALDGALWRARGVISEEPDDEIALRAGDPVVVQRLSGLTLSVRRAEEWELL